MASTTTFIDLRTGARELADQKTTFKGFVQELELGRMVNRALKRWYGMVAQAVPERYETTQTLTVHATLASVTQIAATSGEALLPTDHLTTMYVDYVSTNQDRIALKFLQAQERNAFQVPNSSSRSLGYRLVKDKLVFRPRPNKIGEQYEHRYIPVAPTLINDADTVDGVNGWDQWIVYDCALQMLMKEESQTGDIRAERDRLQGEIESAAALRVWGDSTRVVDTRNKDPFGMRGQVLDPDFWWSR